MYPRALIFLMLALMLVACGQKGDLYLPPEEPENGEQTEGRD